MDFINDEHGCSNSSSKRVLSVKEFTNSILSLDEIESQLKDIIEKAQNGMAFNEKRLDELVTMRDHNEDYIIKIETERNLWLKNNADFFKESVDQQRSFIPPDIHKLDEVTLVNEIGLSIDIAKRVKNKQCLWFVRFSSEEILKLHEADLYNRYNPDGCNLDIIELASIYYQLPPELFSKEIVGNRKSEFAHSLEVTLKTLISEKDSNTLPKTKLRNRVYEMKEGPIEDRTSLRTTTSIRSTVDERRTSFKAVCSRHSILSKNKQILLDDNDNEEVAQQQAEELDTEK